ncbi:hypothetical protein AMAG_06760 [Allomyces macrogynus ATCC 38327]|uniref:Thioredoxin-like fold domain-containing protein n=1 Tax=Allomyces macrogynus (strain ATCC 38327) TaxID=578462 RepID=A0A0L0SEQ1_ALLM3|nr:hypothetical protein AMAG_06760 [Allomyces macrogynus ATCC 38327]|eukprot:KNE60998.1 hypothetical protein AMAG_06760 [Allomyces macrogynus ATCC 38327]
MLGASPNHSNPFAPMALSALNPSASFDAHAASTGATDSAHQLHHDMSGGEPMSVDALVVPEAHDFAGCLVHPKAWQTIDANFELHCRLLAELERKYLFLVFYDPQSIACFQRHDSMTKHQGLSMFIDANFVKAMVPASDPFAQQYCNELFPINAFPLTAIHDPITMRRIAVFADVDRKSFKEGCIKRRLDYLSDPDELLGELATIIDDLPQLPEPGEELLRLFGLPVPENPTEDEKKQEEKAKSRKTASTWGCNTDLFPPSLITTVPTLDEAIGIAQATGRYILISVHADSSSEASRAVNRDLWYYDPILHTLHNKYVVVRLDADVDPMAQRILHTPLTGSEPDVCAHAAPPYVEVMHPFEPLRIPIFGTDPATGQFWGNARADVVEAFLLDLIIKHPVTTLGWTHAEAPPAHFVSYETLDWADGQGTTAVASMKLQGASRLSGAAAATHAWPNGDGTVAVESPTVNDVSGLNGTVEQVQAGVEEDDAAWELVENLDEEL